MWHNKNEDDMKKEIFIHFPFLISFLVLITVVKNWLSITYWPFWVGGVLGMVFPYLDHLLYVFLLRPYELTSQRVINLVQRKDIKNAVKLLIDTKEERKDLTIHTLFFEIIFAILTFFVVTSSNSLLGRGLVLGFFLHLIIDQFKDFQTVGNLNRWFKGFNISLDNNKTGIYLILGGLVLLIIFAFVL
jgi:hypothetical protein